MPGLEQRAGLISVALDEVYSKRMPLFIPATATSTGSFWKDLVRPFMGGAVETSGVSHISGGRMFSGAHPSQTQRAAWARGNRGGTAVLNQMAIDADFQKYRVAAADRASLARVRSRKRK